jgi:hypothetical protein
VHALDRSATVTGLQILYNSLISFIHSVRKALVTESGVELTTKQTTKAPAPWTNPLPPPFVSRSTLLTTVPTSQLCRGFQTHYFFSGSPYKIFHIFFTPSMRSTCSVYLIVLDLSILIISGENYEFEVLHYVIVSIHMLLYMS